MRNLYSLSTKVLALVTACFFIGSMVQAQETINWRGSVSTDATDVQNWDPPTGMAGNHIRVGHIGTYNDPENPNHPIVTGEEDFSFVSIGIAGPYHFIEEDEDGIPTGVEDGPYGPGQITFSMADGSVARQEGPNDTHAFPGGVLIVNSGEVNFQRSYHMTGSPEAMVIVEGTGRATFRDFFGIGDRDQNVGGNVIIRNDGVIHVTGAGRMIRVWDQFSRINIHDNAQLIINGDNRGEYASLVANDIITGGENFYINYYYQNELNQTFYVAKPEGTVWTYFTDRLQERAEFLVVGEAGSEVALENSDVVAAATNFEWKYGTDPEGPYTNVLGSSTEANTFVPTFDESGTFYLVCEVTTPDGQVTSNALTFVVGSANLSLTPDGVQYVRGEQIGAEITVTADQGTIESGEWKWSQTPGVGYQSFDPVISGTSISPSFETPGAYFIRFEGVVDGSPDISSEIRIVQQVWDAGPLNLTWVGGVDDDYHKATNWNPMAQPHRNNIIIPVDVPHYPVFSHGVDTIMGGSTIHHTAAVMDGETVVEPAKSAMLIIRGGETDSLKWRGNVDNFRGILQVESGVFVKDQDLLRMHSNSATVNVTGTGVAIFNQWGSNNHPNLMMGNSNAPTVGGQVHVSGNGKIYFHPAPIFRFAVDAEAEFSFFTVSENGQFIFQGNHTSGTTGYITNRRIRVPEEHDFINVYDHVTDYTYVMARDLNAFGIEQTGMFIMPILTDSEVLTLVNTDGLSEFTWKHSHSPFGPWESFTPEVAGDAVTVQFENIGEYYVVAEAGDGTLSSNTLMFRIIDFAVEIDEDGGVYTLSVELPEGMTALGWQYKSAEEANFEEFELAGTELTYLVDPFDFMVSDGVFHVTYLGVMTDDAGQDVQLLAVPVTVTIADGDLVSVVLGQHSTSLGKVKSLNVGVYPNPNNGTFTLNAGADSYLVEVIDMNGVIVDSRKVSGDGQSITINQKGIFMVKVTSATGVGVSRVIVK
ncbi:T9SS type A sorting domain-containing protein [Natronoflexus pectinivorans]|nr:T9SS type A sorting domain-containing protein [Natronoflexus pectinivorans]